MTRSDNQYLLTALRAAKSSNIKPTSMLFHTQPTEPWKSVDFALLVALQIIEDMTCGQCGQPMWICRSDDNKIEFRIKSSKCRSTARVREKEASMMSKDERDKITQKEKSSWGLMHYAVPAIIPNSGREHLPTFTEYLNSK